MLKENTRIFTWPGVDLKKAFDSVPHDWIHHCLHRFGVHPMIIDFLDVAMTHSRATLTVNGVALGDVSIERGIFQGDILPPLLFVMCLAPLSVILGQTQKGYKVSHTIINHLVYMDVPISMQMSS